jgi:hypothetical protein
MSQLNPNATDTSQPTSWLGSYDRPCWEERTNHSSRFNLTVFLLGQKIPELAIATGGANDTTDAYCRQDRRGLVRASAWRLQANLPPQAALGPHQ